MVAVGAGITLGQVEKPELGPVGRVLLDRIRLISRLPAAKINLG